MTKVAEKILAEAMTLGAEERLALAEALLEDTAPSVDPLYIDAWSAEIQHRLDAYDRGEVGSSSWEDVRQRLLDRRRGS